MEERSNGQLAGGASGSLLVQSDPLHEAIARVDERYLDLTVSAASQSQGCQDSCVSTADNDDLHAGETNHRPRM